MSLELPRLRPTLVDLSQSFRVVKKEGGRKVTGWQHRNSLREGGPRAGTAQKKENPALN